MISRQTALDDRQLMLELVGLFLWKEWSELSGLRERVRQAEGCQRYVGAVARAPR